MIDLVQYGGPAVVCLLLGYLVHHVAVTRQLIERMRVEEQADLQRLNMLLEGVRNQMAPGTPSTMCRSCSVGTAAPRSKYCDACREMMPKLKPAEPTGHTLGGPTTPTGVRV